MGVGGGEGEKQEWIGRKKKEIKEGGKKKRKIKYYADNDWDKITVTKANNEVKFDYYIDDYDFSKFDSIDVVICAYNAGEVAVRNWLDENGNLIEEKIDYAQTATYYTHVLRDYYYYKNHNFEI